MSKYSSHIKQESLRNIVLQDVECENKISQIRDLIGLPPLIETQKESEGGESEKGALDLRSDSIERILEGIEGKELKIARNLIDDLEKANVKWDQNSLALIIDGKEIEHSNLSLIVKKVVHSSSPVLPLGLISFIDTFIEKKIPISYLRDSDSLNIREALLKIRKGESGIGKLDEEPGTSVKRPLQEEPVNSLKRPREEESDSEEKEEDLFGKNESIGGNKSEVVGVRRSGRKRLKPELYNAGWSEVGK